MSPIQSGVFLENDLANIIDLNGTWEFQLGAAQPEPIQVPSAWEASTHDKLTDGPAIYQRVFSLPPHWLDSKIVLQAQAVSYHCVIRVNNHVVGEHAGLWSPFQVDVTPYVAAGENHLAIEVWKPGAHYPARDSLAGFLPDVATTFGGIWQDIRLLSIRQVAAHNVHIACRPDGSVTFDGQLTFIGAPFGISGTLNVKSATGDVARSEVVIAGTGTTVTLSSMVRVAHAAVWSPGAEPVLYTVSLTFAEHGSGATLLAISRRIGFRDISARSARLWMNDSPLHVRGVLDWGWDAAHICPAPSRAEVLNQCATARSLGFNMIKLCLYVPDETTFDVADEQGMLLWLELPMWQPNMTPAFRALAMQENVALLMRVHHHPSLAIISLGCELDTAADAVFLAELGALARHWLPNALHCDNSGSAEAYGGVETTYSYFHDYHFYTDPHFFQPLVDHFTRQYRAHKPWIYGEFCDADTLRDYAKLVPEPWWLTDDLPLQRADLEATRDYRRRLETAGITDQGADLTRIARLQATAVRKYILEHVRGRHATGGYVVTGWMDTPIATSGIVDDLHLLKYSPEDWRTFNADCVLLMDRERRRRWQGGDRPVYSDPTTCWADESPEIHLLLSNGSGDIRCGQLEWMTSTGERFMTDLPSLSGGEVSELVTFQLPRSLPGMAKPEEVQLHAVAALEFVDGRKLQVENNWRIWIVPDKSSCLDAIAAANIQDRITDSLLDRVRGGASAIVWLPQPDERFTRALPFWRESIHVLVQHPLWEKVPHAGYADMRFFGIATDFAIDTDRLQALIGPQTSAIPIWRRFDARAMTWADYIVECRCGLGRLYVTSLRFAGGLGYEPDRLETNPAGAWMLHTLLNLVR